MKTIVVTVGEAAISRNLLRGTFWKYFRETDLRRIILLVPPDKRDSYTKEFGGEHVIIESLAPVPRSTFERVTSFISRNALRTGTTTMNQMRQYYDYGGFFSLLLKQGLSILFGRSKTVVRCIRALEKIFPSHDSVVRIFERYRPDGILLTVMINPELDVPILREAKRRGIPTVGMLRGWDNLTTHGLVRIVPDRMLFQNHYLTEMALQYHFISGDSIDVVGFPEHDWYVRSDLIESREKVFQRFGIDPKKRMILYGAMGDYLFPREGEIAEIFEELVESGKISQDLVMVFRAHPAFTSPLEKMKGMKHVIADIQAHREMGDSEMAHLINSIVHSEMVVTSGSTIAIDAVALGKPAISVAFEKTPINYWLSAKRFRHHYTHYEAMMATGGVQKADNPIEFAAAINRYLRNPKSDENGRKRLRTQFIVPCDGNSGKRIAYLVGKYLAI